MIGTTYAAAASRRTCRPKVATEATPTTLAATTAPVCTPACMPQAAPTPHTAPSSASIQ